MSAYQLTDAVLAVIVHLVHEPAVADASAVGAAVWWFAGAAVGEAVGTFDRVAEGLNVVGVAVGWRGRLAWHLMRRSTRP